MLLDNMVDMGADLQKLYLPADEKARNIKDSYDVVLEYLLSEGHVETVEEADYVMMQMTSEHVQDIVEGKYSDSGYL